MANEEVETQAESAKSGPTVVGMGASAGGLNALKTFFEQIPEDSGLAFVVVVHLSPEHKSILPDLLQPSVRFPVQQVLETVLLKPNHVYVIPPNANLSAIDTHLRLSKLEERRRARAPIDHFFRTLAATHDGHSIGVVLTGTGSDGTLSLREIAATRRHAPVPHIISDDGSGVIAVSLATVKVYDRPSRLERSNAPSSKAGASSLQVLSWGALKKRRPKLPPRTNCAK